MGTTTLTAQSGLNNKQFNKYWTVESEFETDGQHLTARLHSMGAGKLHLSTSCFSRGFDKIEFHKF
jgi:hypothetical protein